MGRYFNTEGICRPDRHYMVKLDDRFRQIRERYIEREKYFVMNRGRQYGKTTTLVGLTEYLEEAYTVIFMDFQRLSASAFENECRFAAAFTEGFLFELQREKDKIYLPDWGGLQTEVQDEYFDLNKMFGGIGKLCGICTDAGYPVVLIIDEVDSASNHRVFLDFLAQLRGYYLERDGKPMFQSVILAGVYDIKNLKLKLRPDEGHQYNSPWNIAAEFDLDMSFSAEQITAMLQEYETDHGTGMCIGTVAENIWQYTSGYPYLVSLICKILDEKLSGRSWTRDGVAEAVKMLLKINTPLFDNMVKQLDQYQELRTMIQEILYQGRQVPFSPLVKEVNLGVMFGFLKEEEGHIAVANRIFEMGLLNMFITEEAVGSTAFQYGQRDKNLFVENGRLNMKLVLEKFVVHFSDIYHGNDDHFVESNGRKLFLLYLKPIINGVGNYYLEAQTRDARRTDVIVDYRGEQFIVEMKIWHGNEYHERGERQLADYLDYYHQTRGYMLSFNFNKRKETGVKEIHLNGKTIIEAVV